MWASEFTIDTVMAMLVPWFLELQMHKLKKECDAIIALNDVFQDCVQVKGEYPFRTHYKGWKSEGRKELRKNLFQYYSMYELYSLPKSTLKAIAEKKNAKITRGQKGFKEHQIAKELSEGLNFLMGQPEHSHVAVKSNSS